jgi:hypothetical protein
MPGGASEGCNGSGAEGSSRDSNDAYPRAEGSGACGGSDGSGMPPSMVGSGAQDSPVSI